MPLKPALHAFRPRGPKPRELRHVNCPHCGHAFSLSRKAQSARCPACTRPMAFEDIELEGHLEGDVATMGHVRVLPHAELVGRLVCGNLHVAGRFQGRATVFGPITVETDSLTSGKLTAKALTVPAGTAFRAKVHITPKPDASRVAAAVAAARPLRRLHKRIPLASAA